MFAAASSGTTRAPFLLDMARDLSTSMPYVADLVAATSISWAVAGMLAGAGSDRWGRRPFLHRRTGGVDFCTGRHCHRAELPACRVVVGRSGRLQRHVHRRDLCRDFFPRRRGQQGRALGWVMSGQSLTLLIGVPVAAFVGSMIGWRGVNLCIGGPWRRSLRLACWRPHAANPRPPKLAGTRPPSTRAALSWPVLAFAGMGIAERVCYGLTLSISRPFCKRPIWSVWTRLPCRWRSLPPATFSAPFWAVNWLISCPNRLMIYAVAMVSLRHRRAGLVWLARERNDVGGDGVLYVFLCDRAAAMMAALAQVPPHVRGTVMGWNVTCSSIGWMGAAGLGGWMLGIQGFAGFGALTAVVAVIGAGLALYRR